MLGEELTRVGAVAARATTREIAGGSKDEGVIPVAMHLEEARAPASHMLAHPVFLSARTAVPRTSLPVLTSRTGVYCMRRGQLPSTWRGCAPLPRLGSYPQPHTSCMPVCSDRRLPVRRAFDNYVACGEGRSGSCRARPTA